MRVRVAAFALIPLPVSARYGVPGGSAVASRTTQNVSVTPLRTSP